MLVAHNGGARLYSRVGNGDWVVIKHWDHPEGRAHADELVSDRAGRSHKGEAGPIALDSTHSPKEAEADRFVRVLTDYLDDGAGRGTYAGLYVAAPPRMLGKLREALGRETHHRLRGTSDHDYAHLADADAAAAVMETLRPVG